MNPISIPKAYLIGGAVIVAAVLFLAIGISYKVAFDKGFTSGGEACRADVATKTAADLAASQKRILHVQKKTQGAEDKINAASPDADGPLAAVLRDQLVRMRPEVPPSAIQRRKPSPRPRNP